MADDARHDDETDQELPEWVPDEYDPEEPLDERLPIMADIEGGIELHVKGDNGVVEIVGQPQHFHDNARLLKLCCGTAPDDWSWEIKVPKKDGIEPSLDKVNPTRGVDSYGSKRHWLSDIDVRMYGVDADRFVKPEVA